MKNQKNYFVIRKKDGELRGWPGAIETYIDISAANLSSYNGEAVESVDESYISVWGRENCLFIQAIKPAVERMHDKLLAAGFDNMEAELYRQNVGDEDELDLRVYPGCLYVKPGDAGISDLDTALLNCRFFTQDSREILTELFQETYNGVIHICGNIIGISAEGCFIIAIEHRE